MAAARAAATGSKLDISTQDVGRVRDSIKAREWDEADRLALRSPNDASSSAAVDGAAGACKGSDHTTMGASSSGVSSDETSCAETRIAGWGDLDGESDRMRALCTDTSFGKGLCGTGSGDFRRSSSSRISSASRASSGKSSTSSGSSPHRLGSCERAGRTDVSCLTDFSDGVPRFCRSCLRVDASTEGDARHSGMGVCLDGGV